MKNFFGLVGILGFVFVASAGCGSGGPTGTAAGAGYKTKAQGAVTGKECSDQLLQDAVAIQQANANAGTLDGLNQLKTAVQNFKGKYDGVVCTTPGQDGKDVTVDVTAKCNEWLDAINKAIQAAGGGNQGGGANPGPVFGH